MENRKSSRTTYLTAARAVIVASTLTGCGLGILSQFLYGAGVAAGAASGTIIGFAAGAGYAGLLIRQRKNGRWDDCFIVLGTVFGMATGLLAAVLVHAVLMVGVRQWQPVLMGVGAIFGIGAGTILGGASSCAFWWFLSKPGDGRDNEA